MATRYWIMNNPAPWEAASFDTGLPGNGDTVIFNWRGRGNVVTGLNQTAVALASLQVFPEYPGNIGAVGNPLIISSTEVVYQGSGTIAYQDGDGTTGLFLCDSANYQDAAYIGGNTITRVRVANGALRPVVGLGTVTHLEVGGTGGNPQVIVDSAVLTIGFATNVRLAGGRIDGIASKTNVAGLILMAGGQWTIPFIPVNVGGTYIQTGGTVNVVGNEITLNNINLVTCDLHLINGTMNLLGAGRHVMSGALLYKWPGFNLITNGDIFGDAPQRMEP